MGTRNKRLYVKAKPMSTTEKDPERTCTPNMNSVLSSQALFCHLTLYSVRLRGGEEHSSTLDTFFVFGPSNKK